MKIKETKERECCGFEDLMNYYGVPSKKLVNWKHFKPKFCKYCGQLWALAAGKYDGVETPSYYEKVLPGDFIEPRTG